MFMGGVLNLINEQSQAEDEEGRLPLSLSTETPFFLP